MSNQLAIDLMNEFARSTGLTGQVPARRYLWTDAFAVCNFLGIYRETDDHAFLDLAVKLVDQVHHTLGRHRDDDPRQGWISGLPKVEGELHPTCCGLRISGELKLLRLQFDTCVAHVLVTFNTTLRYVKPLDQCVVEILVRCSLIELTQGRAELTVELEVSRISNCVPHFGSCHLQQVFSRFLNHVRIVQRQTFEDLA